jgi:hypothetical protein
MELDMKVGGISYSVSVEVEDEYVIGVNDVEVFDGENYFPVEMSQKELDEFYNHYEDELNECYRNSVIAYAECCAEEKWELANDR